MMIRMIMVMLIAYFVVTNKIGYETVFSFPVEQVAALLIALLLAPVFDKTFD